MGKTKRSRRGDEKRHNQMGRGSDRIEKHPGRGSDMIDDQPGRGESEEAEVIREGDKKQQERKLTSLSG